MFGIGTQEIDSLQRTHIFFDPIKVEHMVRAEKADVFVEPSPVLKRKEKLEARPTKRVKISTKPSYEFLDTQDQAVTPYSAGKNLSGLSAGALSNAFNEFLAKKHTGTVRCRVVQSSCAYGCKIAIVEIEKNCIEGIVGRIGLICNSGVNINGQIILVEPRIIHLEHYPYIIAKSIMSGIP